MSYIVNMRLVHLNRIDLNLLLVLLALYEEKNVTRAGNRLGLTQSATSRALARLREHLGDELLVRSRAAMVPTPRLLELGERLQTSLGELDAIVAARAPFDPASTARTFRVAASDYPVGVLIPPLLARCAREAPRLGVAIVAQSSDWQLELESGAIDLAIGPRSRAPAGVVWSKLFSDRFVTVARKDHPHTGRTISLDRFCALSHVVVTPDGRAGASSVDDALMDRGRERHVALRVPSFHLVFAAIAGSELIATVPERLARAMASRSSLHIAPPPLPLPRLSISMAWHERQRHDAAHAWFRKRVAEVAPA
jgi:DNA-binding transcriptional LysR family regulator